ICAGLLMVSKVALAETIRSVHIFQNDSVSVVADFRVPSGIEVHVHNMDAKDNATARLNELVKAQLGSNIGPGNFKEANQQAFSKVLNGPEWHGLYQEMEIGGLAIESAIRYQIKKIPAIVFNGKGVIYGVTSLREAFQIYERRGD